MASGISFPTHMTWLPRARRHDTVTCPACGELECLCRPRFFAGQLLTEEDLNRLDHYIIEKNKLHNRYLHGWGVVCGLEVVCTCERRVTVRQGYAIDPCGNDIIVCEDHIVEVCDLIEQCRARERRRQDCGPYQPPPDDCPDEEEDWLLAICYDEKPSRGITAVRHTGTSTCHSSGSRKSHSSYTSSRDDKHCNESLPSSRSHCRQELPQCEPTIICEGYKFKVFRLPDDPESKQASMINRFQACYETLRKVIPKKPSSSEPKDWYRWCCRVKSRLQEYLKTHPTYDCRLPQELACFRCPKPDILTSFEDYREMIINSLTPILTEFVRYCYCSALLPPCPDPADNACVVLAKVTVNRNGCHSIRVCNWEERKLAITLPNIQYWLSWISFEQGLQNSLIDECCEIDEAQNMQKAAGIILGIRPFDSRKWIFERLLRLWNDFLDRMRSPMS